MASRCGVTVAGLALCLLRVIHGRLRVPCQLLVIDNDVTSTLLFTEILRELLSIASLVLGIPCSGSLAIARKEIVFNDQG